MDTWAKWVFKSIIISCIRTLGHSHVRPWIVGLAPIGQVHQPLTPARYSEYIVNLLTWVLTQENIPCQRGGVARWRVPIRLTLVWDNCFNGVVTLLPSTKMGVFLHEGRLDCFTKEDLECSPKEDLGLFSKFLCFIPTTNCI